jgi:hypothetical protein
MKTGHTPLWSNTHEKDEFGIFLYRKELNTIPTSMDYSTYLYRAVAKFSIDINQVRDKYGTFTYKEWEELLKD